MSREESWSDMRWGEDNIYQGLHLELTYRLDLEYYIYRLHLQYYTYRVKTTPSVLHLKI